jgi:hypothetical protein
MRLVHFVNQSLLGAFKTLHVLFAVTDLLLLVLDNHSVVYALLFHEADLALFLGDLDLQALDLFVEEVFLAVKVTFYFLNFL